jgi:hypothetical protein
VATRRLAKPRPVQGEQAPPRRPAEEPGKPQRRMVILDRIRLTGLLRENPAICRVFLFWGRDRVHHRCITTFGSEHSRECATRRNAVGQSAWLSQIPAPCLPTSLAQKGVCSLSKMTQPSHRRTRGRPCGARRAEWVVQTRRDALLRLVPVRTRRGLSAALSLLVRSDSQGDRLSVVAFIRKGAPDRSIEATMSDARALRARCSG